MEKDPLDTIKQSNVEFRRWAEESNKDNPPQWSITEYVEALRKEITNVQVDK